MSCFVVDLLKSGVHNFDSEIQKVDYGCQGGQKWRSGADRHTLRKVLCSLKSNQLQLWNPVQKLGLLKKPQSHSLFILVLGWFSFPAKATLLHLGTIFSSTVRPFPASCTWGAIPYHHCTCWTWAQLLGHHQPFLGIWDYKNDKSRLAHRSYLKEHWHISYICPVCFGSSWCEFNRGQEPKVKSWGLQWLKWELEELRSPGLALPPFLPRQAGPTAVTTSHLSAQFLSRLLSTSLLGCSRGPGCQQRINTPHREPEVGTYRFNTFYSLLSVKKMLVYYCMFSLLRTEE